MGTVTSKAGDTVTALFTDMRQAEQAYQAALDLGYAAADINVLITEETRQRYLSSTDPGTPLAEKASEPQPDATPGAEVLGGPAGGTMGTVAPAIAAVGAALLIPGLGLAVAGPIAIALTAAGAVGVATGIIGALTNWGIPKDQAQQYESGVRNGGIVIGVTPHNASDSAALVRTWQSSGARLIDH